MRQSLESEGGAVVVAVPYYRCRSAVRTAVTSALKQTYRNLKVVVLSDGDPEPPWEQLSNIDDDRLWRFELPVNFGYYFGLDLIMRGARMPYLAVQDADDWSEPNRIHSLMSIMTKSNCGAVTSAEYAYPDGPDGPRLYEDLGRFYRAPITKDFYRRTQHHGLYRSAYLKSLGGYYGGFRVEYDGLVVQMMRITGALRYTSKPLYHRIRRAGSLTTHPSTRFGSDSRRAASGNIQRMFREMVELYIAGEPGLIGRLGAITQRSVPIAERAYLTQCAQAMSEAMACRSMAPVRLPRPQ